MHSLKIIINGDLVYALPENDIATADHGLPHLDVPILCDLHAAVQGDVHEVVVADNRALNLPPSV